MMLIACTVLNCLCYTCCIVDTLLDVVSIVFPVEFIKYKISNLMSKLTPHLRVKRHKNDTGFWISPPY